MKNSLIVLIAILHLGCAQTYMVTSDGTTSYADVNERATEHDAIVTLRSGEQHVARNLRVLGDSTSWINPETGTNVQRITADLVRVQFIQNGQGALLGLAMGGGVGAAVGFMLGNPGGSQTSTCTLSDLCLLDDMSGPFALIGAGFGALVGAAVGGKVGVSHTYEFHGEPIQNSRNR